MRGIIMGNNSERGIPEMPKKVEDILAANRAIAKRTKATIETGEEWVLPRSTRKPGQRMP